MIASRHRDGIRGGSVPATLVVLDASGLQLFGADPIAREP